MKKFEKSKIEQSKSPESKKLLLSLDHQNK
jgi:hypothetical protein